MYIRSKPEDHIPLLPLDRPLSKRSDGGLLTAHRRTPTRHGESAILHQCLVIPVRLGREAHHQVITTSGLCLVQQVQPGELLVRDVTPVRTERQELIVGANGQLTAEAAAFIPGKDIPRLGGGHQTVDRLVCHPQPSLTRIQQRQLSGLLLLRDRSHRVLTRKPRSPVYCHSERRTRSLDKALSWNPSALRSLIRSAHSPWVSSADLPLPGNGVAAHRIQFINRPT